jgi:hypothetical protein
MNNKGLKTCKEMSYPLLIKTGEKNCAARFVRLRVERMESVTLCMMLSKQEIMGKIQSIICVIVLCFWNSRKGNEDGWRGKG